MMILDNQEKPRAIWSILNRKNYLQMFEIPMQEFTNFLTMLTY